MDNSYPENVLRMMNVERQVIMLSKNDKFFITTLKERRDFWKNF